MKPKKPFNKVSALRIARVAAGLTLADLGRAIDRSPCFVHRIETGGPARLTEEIASGLARACSTSPERIFSESEDR